MRNYMFIVRLSLMLSLLCLPHVAYGHGEEKMGPHGGVIRMPGAFHTEVLGIDKSKVAVYLLDINFNEPTTEDSSVAIKLLQDSRVIPLQCSPEKESFLCKAPVGVTLDVGKLELIAKRKDFQGIVVNYSLPLVAKF